MVLVEASFFFLSTRIYSVMRSRFLGLDLMVITFEARHSDWEISTIEGVPQRRLQPQLEGLRVFGNSCCCWYPFFNSRPAGVNILWVVLLQIAGAVGLLLRLVNGD